MRRGRGASPRHPARRRSPLIELHGHRGARGDWPENTLPGFAAAIAAGVAFIEMDVGLSADGVPVLCHDLALDPDLTRRDGAWIAAPGPLLRSLTRAELRRFDVGRAQPGGRTALAFPAQQAVDGTPPPDLAEVLALDSRVNFAIEIKTDPRTPQDTAPPERLAEAVLAAVEAAGVLHRTRVISFDWRSLRHLRRLRPGLSLGFLTDAETVGDAALWWDGSSLADHDGSVLRAVAAERGAGVTAWGPDVAGLTQAEVAEARALGLLVNPWTVNDAESMARICGWGVDALTTDYPRLALRALADLA